jgi:hypothetical protein
MSEKARFIAVSHWKLQGALHRCGILVHGQQSHRPSHDRHAGAFIASWSPARRTHQFGRRHDADVAAGELGDLPFTRRSITPRTIMTS